MPPIVAFAIAYGAGLTAGLVFLPPWGAVLILSGAAAGAWVVSPRYATLVATLSAGLVAGRMAAMHQRVDCHAAWRPGHHAAWVVVDEPLSRQGMAQVTVVWADCTGSFDARFEAPSAEHPGPGPGETVVMAGTLDDVGRFQVRHWRAMPGERARLPRLRAWLTTRIQSLYGERAPLVEALVLGRRDDVDRGLKKEFADSGLAHLLAIAGLHVGILVTWVTLLAGWCMGRRPALFAGAVMAWCYVALLGFPPPATRAAGFVTIRAVAALRQRHPAPSATLAVAALAVLAIAPTAITTAGFWLSISAVGGMGWCLEGGRLMTRLSDGGSRLAVALRQSPPFRYATQLALGSWAATLATAPVSAAAFGSVAPVGILANMIAIPLAGLAVPSVLLSLIMRPFAAGAGLALAAIERTARLAASIPGGHVSGNPGWRFALPWTLVVLIVWWLRRDRPTAAITHGRLLALSTAGAWALLVFLWPSPTSGGLAIHVLDVGQGDGIAIETPHGHWILIDAGPRNPERDAGRDVVVPFLNAHGVDHLDLALTTHTDADHLGGMPYVLRAERPQLTLDNGQPVGTALYLDYERVLNETHAESHAARAGDSLTIDSVGLAVLSPSAAWMATHLETNANSVVLRLTYGGFSAMLTGDMDSVTEADVLSQARPVDLLKVAHHGSNTSSSAVWLDRLHPKAAVISVGANNHYHHPSPETLLKLVVRNIPYWRTDEGGAVTIRSDGRYFVVTQGEPHSWLENIRCRLPRELRLSCSPPGRMQSFPVSSPTSPPPPRP